MTKISACLAVASFCLVTAAHAEPPVPPPVEYGFEDELVHGDLMRPDSEVVVVRQRNVRASLVEIRASYVPELLKSVEDM